MTTEQIQNLIAEENASRERAMLNTARNLIQAIASKGEQIAKLTLEQGELRKQLKELSMTPVDAREIVGS